MYGAAGCREEMVINWENPLQSPAASTGPIVRFGHGSSCRLSSATLNYCGYKVCYDRTFLVAAKPTPMQKEVYAVSAEMNFRVKDMLKALALVRAKFPRAGRSRSKPQDAGANQGMASYMEEPFKAVSGIAWDSSPYFFSVDDPEFILEKNMTIAYSCHFDVERGGAGGGGH